MTRPAPPAVCVTHSRYLPCRQSWAGKCVTSSAPQDLAAVDERYAAQAHLPPTPQP